MEPTALIVTLRMDPGAAARYTALRQAHFPAHRNFLAAHLTLFHALPVDSLGDVLADAADLAGRTPAFAMRVDGVRFLGAGVAYTVSSPEGVALRRALADRWAPLLGRQDRAWSGGLHVTVQNKVEPAAARALHARLARDFTADRIEATGLEVWHYLGGPWAPVGAADFPRPASTTSAARLAGPAELTS